MPWLELLLIPLGFAVGAYGAIVGAGGGFLLVPALLLVYPDDTQKEITAMSLAVVLANSLSGSLAYARRRLIDYRTGLTFATAMVPASFAGAYAVRFLPRSAFDVTFGLLLVALAVYVAFAMSRGASTVRAPLRRGRSIATRTMTREDGVTSRYAYDVRHGLGLSAVTAFAGALFGVGGGIVQVPFMVTVLRIPLDVAIATSQFMLIFVATAGTSTHALAGDFAQRELIRSVLLAVGAIAGAQVGASISRSWGGTLVGRLLSTGLIVVGARLVLAPVL